VQGPDQPAPQPSAQPSQPVIPGLPELLGELQRANEGNARSLEELRRQGAQIDPIAMVNSRINMLIDSVARFAGQDGPRWAALTRLEFAQAVAREIEEVGGKVTQAQLSLGAQLSPGQIAQLAREAGTFGKRGGW
jgi:hypothetical protein